MQHSPGKRLKALIHAPQILVLPGVFDGFSTRLVRHAGYTAAFITGSGVSESRLGQVDVGLMGLEENVAAGRPARRRLRELVIGRLARGYVALYRYVAELDTVFVLAIRARKEAGYTKT